MFSINLLEIQLFCQLNEYNVKSSSSCLYSLLFSGYGGLGLSIEGPSKVDINCDDLADGVCKVSYTPQEPGNYVINVKFADKHVPGSPFTVPSSGGYWKCTRPTLFLHKKNSTEKHLLNRKKQNNQVLCFFKS